jgi:hypothetical protein
MSEPVAISRAAIVAAVLFVAAPALAAFPATDTIADEVAHALVDGRYDAAAARFDAKVRTRIGPAELAQVLDPLRATRGPAREVHVVPHEGYAVIFVDIQWTRGPATQLEIAFADDARIIGLMVRDRPPSDYEAKTVLHLPFHGTWSSMNAERNMSNPHFKNPNQMYAVDWIMRDDHLKSFRTDGKRNEDYYAYKQEALAPAGAVVAIVVDGVPENPDPGAGDGDHYNIIGNHVVLDFGNGEYALLAHLVPGSIRVHVGDHVTVGQTLGLVGNSGHSSEPHLHFQLMDAPRLTVAHSLPAKYDNVLVNGKLVKRAWPVTGNRVSAVERRR